MKKIAVILFCLLTTLFLFACKNGNKEIKPGVLHVGYGRMDITPYNFSMPMNGYGNNNERLSTGVDDPIYATCIAFTDEKNNTILLYQMDMGNPYGEVTINTRAISKATGVPAKNIIFSATHTHDGPGFSGGVSSDIIAKYMDMIADWVVEAAKTAMADRKPAEMYMATTTLENMNFGNHYLMSSGEIVGDNFGKISGTYVKHTIDADNTMQILRFVRKDTKDVVMVNWQTKPIRNAGRTHTKISSDIVGPMRDYVEKHLDCNFAYFTGASGNVNPTSRISAENVTKNYIEQGKKMGEYAVAACENMTKVITHNVQIVEEDYVAKSTEKPDQKFPLSAFSIGDVGFICAPYEMFSENGQQIKEASPFKMTFVVTYANAICGYVPSKPTYVYGGFEVEYNNYVEGTAEALVDRFASMLNELHKTR